MSRDTPEHTISSRNWFQATVKQTTGANLRKCFPDPPASSKQCFSIYIGYVRILHVHRQELGYVRFFAVGFRNFTKHHSKILKILHPNTINKALSEGSSEDRSEDRSVERAETGAEKEEERRARRARRNITLKK